MILKIQNLILTCNISIHINNNILDFPSFEMKDQKYIQKTISRIDTEMESRLSWSMTLL